MNNPETNKSGFSIEVTCPGCGGELELQEKFLILHCNHCGSVLRVDIPESTPAYLVKNRTEQSELRFQIDRFLKEHDLPLSPSNLQVKSLYYPYWKVDAIKVAIRTNVEKRERFQNSEYEKPTYTEHQKQETSISKFSTTISAGVPLDGIPVSIGLRIQFLKFKPFSTQEIDEDFDCMPVVRSSDDIFDNEAIRFASIGEQSIEGASDNRTDLIDPEYEIIYFPFHIIEMYDQGELIRFLIDGVTGKPLEVKHPKLSNPDFANATSVSPLSTQNRTAVTISFGKLSVSFHRCPNCGIDLPSENTEVSICKNCQELVFITPNKIPVSGVYGTEETTNSNDIYFPFWTFELLSDNKLVRDSFSGIYKSDYIVIPAFLISNFEVLYRLSERISAASARLEQKELISLRTNYLPIEISIARALTLAKVVVYRKLLERNSRQEIDLISINPPSASLRYVSFHPESYFWVDSTMGVITFEKAAHELVG